MSYRVILLASALAISAAALTACSSERGISMNEEDARIWMSARSQNGVGVLDDGRYKIEFGAVGDSQNEDDTLEFMGGRLRSAASDEHHFGSGPYATRSINDGVEFHATCKSSTGGTIWWHGTVRGDDIEGGFVTTVPGEPTVEYAFHGENLRAAAVK